MFLVKKYLDKRDNTYFVYPTKKKGQTDCEPVLSYFVQFN